MTNATNRLDEISTLQNRLIVVDGQTKVVPVRVPNAGQYCVNDGVNFTVSVDSFACNEFYSLKTSVSEILSIDSLDSTQYSYVMNLVFERIASDVLSIFGDDFANYEQMKGFYHFHRHGFVFKSSQGEPLLNIGIGSKHNTVLFSLTGMGAKFASDGWEHRLYHWLDNVSVNPKITRCHIAFDDFDGKFTSFNHCNEQESLGKFMLPKTRNRPSVRILGEYKHNDPYNKGLTLYVGKRENKKMFRGYEKGKQLGDILSSWFRGEIEVGADDKHFIPLDILINPTDYFCGAYPYCLELVESAKKSLGDCPQIDAKKRQVIENQAMISLKKAIATTKNQFGRYYKTLGEIFTIKDDKGNVTPDYQKIYELVITDKQDDFYPKRLKICSKLHKQNSIIPQSKILKAKKTLQIFVKPSHEKDKSSDGILNKGLYYETERNFAWC